ncbi:3-beta hydroxysteroid dehydrogenase [Zhengella mangrovi]|uniref:3-beta hydroxysteroid dehydrogenase n=1 Tax=Zhengella mangrovi TaxID=1982044 RepID=A0A2G1QMT4_9HYPH|nr:NAD(P)-dependent oxidoreductase [Zhengella mangrovi]PHP66774.1 3-beta hydroxysteroid dehydrogenase [Zhengella mangrovi]
MKIAVIGAAGNAGQRIVSEALSRGHQITAIGPTASKLEALGDVTAVTGDITAPDDLASKLAGHDIVVSAVRFVRYEPKQLLDAVRKSGVSRLAVIGGAGSLTSPAGGLVKDGPNFPAVALPEATAGGKVLDALQDESDIDWTFLSPSAIFAAGERTGDFRLGKDELLIAADGKSHISFEDFAVAFLDEIEMPKHSRQRFTVGY